MFTENYFGGNGGSDGCVSDGPFASWKKFYPSPACLRRKFSAGNGKIGSFYAPEGVQLMIDRATTFDGLRTTIEGSPHGIVHIGIGGDMSTMASPNDPLFWAHHGMVDKIWADWQKLDRSFLLDYGGPKAASTDILTPFGSRVSDMLNTTADGLCYDYAENWEIPPELPSTAPEATVTVSKSVKSTTTTKVSSTASSDPIVTSHSDVVEASSQPTETSEPNVDGTVIPTTDKSSDASQTVWSFFRSISVTRYQKIRTPLASRRFIWTKETSLSGGQMVLGSTTDTHTTHDMDMGMDTDMDMDMTTSDPADQPDFDYRHMGYQAPASDDREDTPNLRIPKPMPYAWLRAMKMDIGVARATEMALAQMTDELNKLADYVSPAALVNTGGGSTASTTTVPLTKKLRRRHHIEL